jgi:predicted N-acetyltransferase YhbS
MFMPANLKLALAPADIPEVFNPEAEIRLAVERTQDAADVDALVGRAFGPGRYAKVSERLREGNHRLTDLSFCAFGAETLVGTVRQWPVLVGEARGVFLGPIAVEGAWRQHGVGGRLIRRCIEAATEAGEAYILLVGDLPLFGPHGFERAPAGRVAMPSPVNPARVLVHPLQSGGFEAAGIARAPKG